MVLFKPPRDIIPMHSLKFCRWILTGLLLLLTSCAERSEAIVTAQDLKAFHNGALDCFTFDGQVFRAVESRHRHSTVIFLAEASLNCDEMDLLDKGVVISYGGHELGYSTALEFVPQERLGSVATKNVIRLTIRNEFGLTAIYYDSESRSFISHTRTTRRIDY